MQTPLRQLSREQGIDSGSTWHLGRFGGLLAALSLLFLAGCRISVAVPVGGTVTSDQGVVCAAGETCVVDPTDTSYAESFEAVAGVGYEFTGWAPGACGGSVSPVCALTTAVFAGNPFLEALLDGDITINLVPVFEPIPGRYDVAEWQSLLATADAPQYRSDTFLYQSLPDVGSCDPGVLNAAATDRFATTLNLIRKLHNLPAVDYDTFYNTQMQEANMVQLANNYFTHSPQPGDTCYTAGAAAGAGSSNISWSSRQPDPAVTALGWANDNNNVSSLMAAGHRRWMLFPNLGYTSFGQVVGYSSMKVFNFGGSPGYQLPDDLSLVAFPFLNYPYVMVSKGSRPTPWSLSIVPSSGYGNYAYFSSATVSVKDVATGANLSIADLHYDSDGYGLPNFLSWMVGDWEYDTPYLVTINNVQMPDGSVTIIEYHVEIDYEEFQ